MENEYGMIGALVGAAIIVVGFILVVLLGKILLRERQEREKEKLDKVKLEETNEIKKELNSTIEEPKLKLDKCETLKKPVKKRVSKYNNENTLYIAYDFNILGNKSFAEVNKIIEKRKRNIKGCRNERYKKHKAYRPN